MFEVSVIYFFWYNKKMEDIIKPDDIKEKAPEILPSRKIGMIERGALKYIADENGHPISDGFHNFEVFTAEGGEYQIRGIIGNIGAEKYALRPSVSNNRLKILSSEESFHDIDFRKDLLNRFVIETGALNYVVDNRGKKIHDKGYHEILFKNGKYYGKLGAEVEEISIPEDEAEDIKLIPNKTIKGLIKDSN